ncbi:uncharacterized protein LOC107367345 [Tetranychus urticae]|uniref:Corticotropin-releasing factor domain-containing protein n=1 Tax=Tetranychus urticae TaxID=32264 RepID=T1KU94_TETUR|nr:uncharacterized protein LOC107367345 [Tetranychus urticae]
MLNWIKSTMSYTVIVTFTLIYSTLTIVSSQSFNENSNWLNSLQNPLTGSVSSQQSVDQQGNKVVFLKYVPSIKPLKVADGWQYENGPILYGKRASGSRLSDLPPPPPGFVGSRGRRAEFIANDNDIRSTLINKMAKSMGISPLLLLDRLRQNESKKKDLLPYKDAFMGSRG